MEFPLEMRFKLLALAPQLKVTDAGGATVAYVQQKLFKLREAVSVYADAEKRQVNYEIVADRILDFSASYHFRATDGRPIGAVRRRGMRSLWRAHYEIVADDQSPEFEIVEANPWVKLLDSLVGSVPVLEFFTGYFLHPAYEVRRGEEVAARMVKQPAFWEGLYRVERLAAVTPAEEERILLSLLMVVLLERERG